jgi:hypothetical protein
MHPYPTLFDFKVKRAEKAEGADGDRTEYIKLKVFIDSDPAY